MNNDNPNLIWSSTVLTSLLKKHNVSDTRAEILSNKYMDVLVKYAELGTKEAEMIEYAKNYLTLDAYEDFKKILTDSLDTIDKAII